MTLGFLELVMLSLESWLRVWQDSPPESPTDQAQTRTPGLKGEEEDDEAGKEFTQSAIPRRAGTSLSSHLAVGVTEALGSPKNRGREARNVLRKWSAGSAGTGGRHPPKLPIPGT